MLPACRVKAFTPSLVIDTRISQLVDASFAAFTASGRDDPFYSQRNGEPEVASHPDFSVSQVDRSS
jgi:hypothetical protein